MTGDTSQAQQASNISTNLMNQYKAVGLPALQHQMGYLRGSLAQGQPQYVKDAYAGAQTGALESSISQMGGARAQLVKNLAATGGGAYLGGLGKIQGAGATALANEVGHISTTQALAGVEQRNKLLSLMAGNGASATNLSAGFGQLTNEGLGQSAGAQSSQTFGLINGGLSALTSLYANSQINSRPSLGYNPNSLASSINADPTIYGSLNGAT
jgi:hypothetical protein